MTDDSWALYIAFFLLYGVITGAITWRAVGPPPRRFAIVMFIALALGVLLAVAFHFRWFPTEDTWVYLLRGHESLPAERPTP